MLSVYILNVDSIQQDIKDGNQQMSLSNLNYITATLGQSTSKPWIELSPRNIYLLTRDFWANIVGNINDSKLTQVMVQFQFKYLEEEGHNEWRSLGHICTTDLTLESMNSLADYASRTLWNREANYYTPNSGDYPNPIDHPRLVAELSMRYVFVTSDYPLTLANNLKRIIASDTFILGDGKDPVNLINSADPNDWSAVVVKQSDTIRQFSHGGLLYTFTSLGINKQKIDISSYANLQTIQSFTDEIKDINNLRTFNRIFNTETRSYVDGTLIHVYENDTKFMSKGLFHPNYSFKVITMDLETRLNSSNIMEPISISLYSPIFAGFYKTYFITDFNNSANAMIKACLLDLVKPEYNGYSIYLHNLSNFDGVFLLKVLAQSLETKNIKALIKDGKILDLTLKVRYTKLVNGKKTKAVANIHMRDSLLLLTNSLAKLAKAFNVTNKGSFDMNKLQGITNSGLEAIRDELLKYNKLDCLVLYQVLEKFAELIFKSFHINITNHPTISSLALAIYRLNFLQQGKKVPKARAFNIPISNKKIFDHISQSYRGGHVDMFKPFGKKLYCYDINSLYPYVMAMNFFPVGIPKYFRRPEGPYKDLNNIFGFVKVNIYCPDSVKMPILLTKVRDKVIAPNGRWTGWYFTEELKYAITLGYEIEILCGYHFDKKKIFNKFVNTLYKMRVTYDKADPRNLMAKLILNSLYGRFGMSIYTKTYKVLNYLQDKLDPNETFSDYIDWGDVGIYQFDTINNSKNSKAHMNVSISIASAVTAYGRIAIHKFKLIAGDDLYYTDTDSIFTKKPLPNRYVGTELGQMKLEYKGIIEKGIFLAPKLYALILSDGSQVVKIKGVNSPLVRFEDLETLLTLNNTLDINKLDKEAGGQGNIRWTRNWVDGYIKQVETSHLIMVHENKRELIYDNNILVGSKTLNLYGCDEPKRKPSSYQSPLTASVVLDSLSS